VADSELAQTGTGARPEPVPAPALDVGSSRYVSRVSEEQARATPVEYETPAETTWGPTGWDLVTRFRQVHHALQLSLDRALENEGLSFAQVEVMAELGDRPNLHAGAIARRLGIRRQSAHALLTKLHAMGLVAVMPRKEGVRCAYLTDIGKTVAWRCMDTLQPGVGGLSRLTAAERRRILRTLDDVEAALRPPRHWWFD
jgi:DNA-binding MarR family transcriptional regulator